MAFLGKKSDSHRAHGAVSGSMRSSLNAKDSPGWGWRALLFAFFASAFAFVGYRAGTESEVLVCAVIFILIWASSAYYWIWIIRKNFVGSEYKGVYRDEKGLYSEAVEVGIFLTISLTCVGDSASIIARYIFFNEKGNFLLFSKESLSVFLSDSTLLWVILGAPTIIGLLCTFISSQQHLLPRSLGFADVVESINSFITKRHLAKPGQTWFTFCGHYPGFGIANLADCKKEFSNLFGTIQNPQYNVEILCLPLDDLARTENCLEGKDITSSRPKSMNLAVAELIKMWWDLNRFQGSSSRAGRYPDKDDAEPQTVHKKFEEAMKELKTAYGVLCQREAVRNVHQVPEYSVTIAYRDPQRMRPYSAYLVFPFVTPGLLNPHDVRGDLKIDRLGTPMFGVEIQDRSIVESLNAIVRALPTVRT